MISRIDFSRYPSLRKLFDEALGRRLAKINAGILLALIFALMFLPWIQTSRGQGKVLAFNPNDREQMIDATVDGRVANWLVNEGSAVNTGDPIAEMADFDPQFMVRLSQERESLQLRLQAAQKATNAGKKNLDRQRQLMNDGLVARREYERSEIDYSSYLAAEASASIELTRVDTRLSRQSNQFIHAPRSGVISRILVREGNEIVKTGEVIAILVPKLVQRSAQLYLTALDLPLIHPGQNVRLQFEGWPSIQLSGWPSIAVGTFAGEIANADPSVDEFGKFRILVNEKPGEPWPDERYLRQGMRARGWVQLGKVRLGYELWRNFNGFPTSDGIPPKEAAANYGSGESKK